MKNLVIRRATLNDLAAIQELNLGLFDYEMKYDYDTYIHGWSMGQISADYFSELILNEFVVVATIDKKIIGYLAGSVYHDETYSYYEGITAEVDNMFILENYRKFGIGSKLMNSFFDWTKTQNVKRVLVTASIGNENTIKFYEKHGFEKLNVTLRKEFN